MKGRAEGGRQPVCRGVCACLWSRWAFVLKYILTPRISRFTSHNHAVDLSESSQQGNEGASQLALVETKESATAYYLVHLRPREVLRARGAEVAGAAPDCPRFWLLRL